MDFLNSWQICYVWLHYYYTHATNLVCVASVTHEHCQQLENTVALVFAPLALHS